MRMNNGKRRSFKSIKSGDPTGGAKMTSQIQPVEERRSYVKSMTSERCLEEKDLCLRLT